MSTSSNVETQAMQEAVRTKLAPSLLPHFHSYREQLIQANAKDLGHDDNGTSSSAASGSSTPISSAQNGKESAGSVIEKKDSKSSNKSGGGLSTTKVEVEAELGIRKEDLWDLLTNQARIPMWTRAPAQVSAGQLDDALDDSDLTFYLYFDMIVLPQPRLSFLFVQ